MWDIDIYKQECLGAFSKIILENSNSNSFLHILDKDQKLSEVYKSFFKFYFDMFQKKTSKRREEIRDRLNEAGLELDVSEGQGMSPEEEAELVAMIKGIEETMTRHSQQQATA